MSTDLDAIHKLNVPVIVQVGRRQLPFRTVLDLGPGAIINLEKPAEEDLGLLVNNKRIGTGQAVKVGENFGVQITSIGSAAQLIKAMGPDEPAD